MSNAASKLCGRCFSAQARIANRPSLAGSPKNASFPIHHLQPLTASPCHPPRLPTLRSYSSRSGAEAQSSGGIFQTAAPSGWTSTQTQPSSDTTPLVSPDDLFHPFSKSPVPDFRRRALTMRQNAYCPHPDHKLTRLPTKTNIDDSSATLSPSPQQGHLPPAHVDFECPDCGLPVYCSKDHWMDHYDAHLEVCDTLRQINEDDHHVKSQRVFREGMMPGRQIDEAVVNMLNWDTYMYTREHEAIHSERGMRQVTRMLTYPVTIASVLHELSPYQWSGKDSRVTAEGMKSFAGGCVRIIFLDESCQK